MITKEQLAAALWKAFEEEAQNGMGYVEREIGIIDGSDWNMERIAEIILLELKAENDQQPRAARKDGEEKG